MFFKEISKEPEFNIEISECKPVVSLKIINDKLEIKFSEFIDDFKRFLEFPNRKYIGKEKKIVLPKEELEKVINLTKELNYEFRIMVDE